jgi:glutamyl-tRNA reductase
MKVSVLGINHKTAPISLRNQLVFNQDILVHSLENFKHIFKCGVVILSTCNRTEIYSSEISQKNLEKWLSKQCNVNLQILRKYTYFFTEENALNHSSAVGSGLDSMIIGEPQILGQMKQAFKVSENSNLVDKNLVNFFAKVFEFAKIIRNKTQIGTNSTTIASTALKLINQLFGTIESLSILFIGAGEMNELCAKYFAKSIPKKIMVANRTLEKASTLAKKINAECCLISDVNSIIKNYDVVISCTGSQLPIIGLGMVEEAIKLRKHQPMFFIDLAVPADIEKEIGDLDDIFLYNLEDLANIAKEGINLRKNELEKAFNLLKEMVDEFVQNKKTSNVPLTIALKQFFNNTQEIELKKALKDIKNGVSAEEVCEKLSRNLTKKLLHYPTKAINQDSGQAKIIKTMFNLKD